MPFVKGHPQYSTHRFKKGIAPWNKGMKVDREKYPNMGAFGPRSEEVKKRMKITNLGKGGWNKGKKFPELTGEGNPVWRGDIVGYRALHHWVVRSLGKASSCSNNSAHIAKIYHWANISGEYKRDLSDWHELCPSCNRLDGIRIAKRFTEGRVHL